MVKRSKKYKKVAEIFDKHKKYSLDEAIEILKKVGYTKFDPTVELHVNLGVDPKNSSQMVRGSVNLPHGTGKKVRVLVFAKGEKVKEAEEAGADYYGGEELVEKVANGFLDFDKAVATPDIMSKVGRLGRILGPRGLMPNPKTGTVTMDIKKIVRELKGGRVDFRIDRYGVIHTVAGKLSFSPEQIKENIISIMDTIKKLKPASTKGVYIKGVTIAPTMGPGIKVNEQEF